MPDTPFYVQDPRDIIDFIQQNPSIPRETFIEEATTQQADHLHAWLLENKDRIYDEAKQISGLEWAFGSADELIEELLRAMGNREIREMGLAYRNIYDNVKADVPDIQTIKQWKKDTLLLGAINIKAAIKDAFGKKGKASSNLRQKILEKKRQGLPLTDKEKIGIAAGVVGTGMAAAMATSQGGRSILAGAAAIGMAAKATSSFFSRGSDSSSSISNFLGNDAVSGESKSKTDTKFQKESIKLLKEISKGIKELNKKSGGDNDIGDSIAAGAAGGVASQVMTFFGKKMAGGAMTGMLMKIALPLLAVAGLVGFGKKIWEWIQENFTWEKIKEVFEGIGNLLMEAWAIVADVVGKGWESLKEIVGRGWDSLKKTVSEGWESIKKTFTEWGQGLSNVADSIYDAAVTAFNNAFGTSIPTRAEEKARAESRARAEAMHTEAKKTEGLQQQFDAKREQAKQELGDLAIIDSDAKAKQIEQLIADQKKAGSWNPADPNSRDNGGGDGDYKQMILQQQLSTYRNTQAAATTVEKTLLEKNIPVPTFTADQAQKKIDELGPNFDPNKPEHALQQQIVDKGRADAQAKRDVEAQKNVPRYEGLKKVIDDLKAKGTWSPESNAGHQQLQMQLENLETTLPSTYSATSKPTAKTVEDAAIMSESVFDAALRQRREEGPPKPVIVNSPSTAVNVQNKYTAPMSPINTDKSLQSAMGYA